MKLYDCFEEVDTIPTEGITYKKKHKEYRGKGYLKGDLRVLLEGAIPPKDNLNVEFHGGYHTLRRELLAELEGEKK